MHEAPEEKIGTAPRVAITREDRSTHRVEGSQALVRKADRKRALLARIRDWLIKTLAKPI